MKITKAEGYKKPGYAVAIAAAMMAAALGGCGNGEEPGGIDYAGGISMYTPPEDEVQLAGDVSVEQINNVIDYDGGLEIYTEPEYDKDSIETDGFEGKSSEYYCEPIDDELVLDGDVAICDPGDDHLVLEGGAPLYEP